MFVLAVEPEQFIQSGQHLGIFGAQPIMHRLETNQTAFATFFCRANTEQRDIIRRQIESVIRMIALTLISL